MKKYFILFAIALFAISCQKENGDESITSPTTSTSKYCDNLTINLGTDGSRGSFNDGLVWSWDNTDEIIGYQNAGDKTRNTLTHQEGSQFGCENFSYSTTTPAKFHFVYPASAEQADKTLVAPQDGTWNPILVGTTNETTLQSIGTVTMQHLTSALEIRSSGAEKITAISLTSPNEFLGSWTVKEDLSYEQNFAGNSLEVSDLNVTSYVINMPALTAEALKEKAITLSVTTTGGVTTSKKLSGMAFEAGKRTIINIRTASTLDRDKFLDEILPIQIDNPGITAFAFKVNSSTTSEIEVQTSGSITPIYIVKNGNTLEVHTAAQKIMAPADCTQLFSSLQITSIDFSGFDTSNVTNMHGMFFFTSLSTQLDLSNFDTSNVTNMDSMFLYCSVSSLDLSSFNFGNVTEFDNMFKGLGYLLASPDICKVYVSADSYTWTEDKNFGVGNYQITVK